MLKYFPQKSVLHSSDARIKILALTALVVLFVALPLAVSALALPLALALLAVARIPSRKILEQKLLVFAALLPLVFRFFFEKTIYSALSNGVLNAFYVLGILLLAELLVFTTRVRDFERALLFFRVPRRIVFMFSLAVQAIPLLQERVLRTCVAQKTRGSDANIFALFNPVLHGIFCRARKLALSLECRGSDPEKL